MSMRDQLLKSGLATKEQAKKAQREASKRQHQSLQEKKSSTPDPNSSLAAQALEAQREADRLRSQKLNEERLQKEAGARARDIIANHDLRDNRGMEPYYFVRNGGQIDKVLVNELQQTLLAQGQLAIVRLDEESPYAVVSEENAVKIKAANPGYIICYHGQSQAPQALNECAPGIEAP